MMSNTTYQYTVHLYITLVELILTYIFSEFKSEYYLQICGISVGTPFAPTYVNIYMGHLEKNHLSYSMHRPFTYFIYSDDILII